MESSNRLSELVQTEFTMAEDVVKNFNPETNTVSLYVKNLRSCFSLGTQISYEKEIISFIEEKRLLLEERVKKVSTTSLELVSPEKQKSLDPKANINAINPEGNTPITALIKNNQIKLVEKIELLKRLIKDGADVNAKDGFERTPITTSIVGFSILDLLKKGEIKPFEKTQFVKNPNKAQVSTNVKDDLGATPTTVPNVEKMTVCDLLKKNEMPSLERLQLVKCLIDGGADVNVKDGFGLAAITYAISNPSITIDEKIQLVKCLVAGGADVDAVNNLRRTPITYTILDHSMKIDEKTQLVKCLVEQGAGVNVKDGLRYTPLTYVVSNTCSIKLGDMIESCV